MKIIYILLISAVLNADTVMFVNSKSGKCEQKYLKIDGDSCYYKNLYYDRSNCYKQTGNILIRPKKLVNKKFLDKYNLEYISDVNKQNFTSLYKSLNNSLDIITIVNKINKENDNLNARVEWIRPRRLY